MTDVERTVERAMSWPGSEYLDKLGAERQQHQRDAAAAPKLRAENDALRQQLRGAVEALEHLAARYVASLAGKPVRDADEVLERARLIVDRARGQ